jgi:hypothetical protein
MIRCEAEHAYCRFLAPVRELIRMKYCELVQRLEFSQIDFDTILLCHYEDAHHATFHRRKTNVAMYLMLD